MSGFCLVDFNVFSFHSFMILLDHKSHIWISDLLEMRVLIPNMPLIASEMHLEAGIILSFLMFCSKLVHLEVTSFFAF